LGIARGGDFEPHRQLLAILVSLFRLPMKNILQGANFSAIAMAYTTISPSRVFDEKVPSCNPTLQNNLHP
jgi:hypothetical protein